MPNLGNGEVFIRNMDTFKSYDVITAPSGRKYMSKNLGTDSSNPNGKYYTFNEAINSCPKGTRLPTWDEIEEDIDWLAKVLPLGASADGGKIGINGYYWTGEDENVVSGSAIFYVVEYDGSHLINVMKKDNGNLVRCVVI